MSWCGKENGGDAADFPPSFVGSGKSTSSPLRAVTSTVALKDARWNRVQFDHAIMYKGKLRLIEFDDEDYEGKNNPHREEKIHACGVSNVPFRIFFSRDLYQRWHSAGDVEEQILSFVFTNVVGKQDVSPSRGSWDFVQSNLSWQMKRQFDDKGKWVYGWARKYILDGNAVQPNPYFLQGRWSR